MKKLTKEFNTEVAKDTTQWQARYRTDDFKTHTKLTVMATNFVVDNEYIDSGCLFSASNADGTIYLYNDGRYHSKVTFDTTKEKVTEQIKTIKHYATNGKEVVTDIKVGVRKNNDKPDLRLTIRAYLRDYVKDENPSIVNAGSKGAAKARQLKQAKAQAEKAQAKNEKLHAFLLSKLTEKQREALTPEELEEYGIAV